MEYTVSLYGKNAASALTQAIGKLLSGENKMPVLLCVGSDKITGDCLGPLVGYLLTERYGMPAYVYGTMRLPVTAKNVETAVRFITRAHPNCPVFALDAALSSSRDIGLVRLRDRGLCPGGAFGKGLPAVGHYSLTAVVNSGGRNNERLFSTSLGRVLELAEMIAAGIHAALMTRFAPEIDLAPNSAVGM